MKKETSFNESVRLLCLRDGRYDQDAYIFMRFAVEYASQIYSKPTNAVHSHVSAKELLEGIRQFAMHEFGPMACTVLNGWGIKRTEDFGEIVYNLIKAELFRQSKTDRKADFADGYDFDEAFRAPYRPTNQKG